MWCCAAARHSVILVVRLCAATGIFLLSSAVVHCLAIFVVRLCAAAEIFLLFSAVAHSFDIFIVRLYATVYILFWFIAVSVRFVCPVLLLCRLLRHPALWHLHPIDNIFNLYINNSILIDIMFYSDMLHDETYYSCNLDGDVLCNRFLCDYVVHANLRYICSNIFYYHIVYINIPDDHYLYIHAIHAHVPYINMFAEHHFYINIVDYHIRFINNADDDT
ncbi:hypothetical protein AK812_SmicGene32007 [Symbiodinium microadriaticum]|uniref:Uncharacterized protein n=1 Tax=Symbiodinium microadriaticum TaxID=2951 RepID=A0A1Q9CVA5_SYMMI|nr:hypothetical protein AK812_SmicGene32007 [Symbiodinium microadriaticum]